ncbi:MAG TPA: TolC family protein [Chryseosolibacter sp.]
MKRTIPNSSVILWAMFGVLIASSAPGQSRLNEYVKQGLESNLVLQQKNLSLKQAQHALQTARSYFLPTVTLLADYTSGEGGRNIAIPVGDMLNPVYATLNQMTQSDAFPQIENVEQNFFPKNFYDARVRTTLPIINTDIHINQSIQGRQVMLKQYELETYRRELVLDIKTAYFNMLSADAAVKIYESAQTLVNRNVAINESLLEHGKALPANLIRSRSEAEKVKADLNMARNRKENAQKYFNFLLNRDLDSEVILEDEFEAEIALSVETDSLAWQQREELQMIKATQDINESSIQMHKLSRLPKVNAFLDVGTQASDWRYNDDSRYYLVGVQLSMPIFQGFRNNRNIQQGMLELQKNQHQLSITSQQLDLATSVALSDQQTAAQNYIAAQEQQRSAKSYFNLVEKGYRNGVNSLIEFLDARNELTTSQLQQSLRKYEWLTAQARVERETASYNFQN